MTHSFEALHVIKVLIRTTCLDVVDKIEWIYYRHYLDPTHFVQTYVLVINHL